MKHTMIAHSNEVISLSKDSRVLKLRDTLADGVVVEQRRESLAEALNAEDGGNPGCCD